MTWHSSSIGVSGALVELDGGWSWCRFLLVLLSADCVFRNNGGKSTAPVTFKDIPYLRIICWTLLTHVIGKIIKSQAKAIQKDCERLFW